VEKGAKRAGRSLADIDVSVGGFSAFGETQSEVEQAISSPGSSPCMKRVGRSTGWPVGVSGCRGLAL